MSSEDGYIKNVAFLVTFLGIFILLMATMPSDFFPPTSSYTNYSYPSNFTLSELGGIKYLLSYNMTFAFPANIQEYDFNPGYNYLFRVGASSLGGYHLYFQHKFWYLWGPFEGWDDMNVEVLGEYDIYREDVVTHIDSTNKSKFFPLFCDHASITTWISDSSAARNEVLTAWDAGTVTVSLGFGFNMSTATMSGWEFMGQLLTFQAPEILGMSGTAATILNAAIALPIWAMIIALVIITIEKILPFF